jgi:hypothetical protein
MRQKTADPSTDIPGGFRMNGYGTTVFKTLNDVARKTHRYAHQSLH